MKKFIPIVIIVIIAVAVIVGIIIYISSGSEKVNKNKPEGVIENFCAYFNSANWEKMLTYVDEKGYYIFLSELSKESYPKFEETYKNFDETKEDYQNYLKYLKECKKIDSEVYETAIKDVKLTVKNILSVTKIQGTKELYLIKADFEISSGSEKETISENIYVAKIDGEYKMLFGYLPDVVYGLLQSVYNYNSYYSN